MALTGKGLGPLGMRQRAIPYALISSENTIIKKNIIIKLLL